MVSTFLHHFVTLLLPAINYYYSDCSVYITHIPKIVFFIQYNYDTDYTVVKNEKGEYRYAELSVDRKKLVPSNKKVGKSSNQKYSESKVWKKNIRPDKDEYNDHNTNIILDGGPAVGTPSTSSKRRARSPRGGNSSCDDNGGAGDIPYAGSLRNKQVPYEREEHHRRTASTAPVIGTLKNLVILLKFKDHKNQNRSVPSKDDVSVLMNSEEVDEDLAPTGSLKMIYWENSYGQLTIESEVTDWIDVKEDESYYANGQSGIETTEKKFHEALKDALDQLESENFNFTKFDKDGDDNIDGITFLTSGYGAEWGNGKNFLVSLYALNMFKVQIHEYGLNFLPCVCLDRGRIWG